MRALRIQSKDNAQVVSGAEKPELRPNQLLIKTHAVGLNPTDWKHIRDNDTKGLQVGCDYAGEVVEIGEAVTKPWKKGDRVFGVVHGGNVSRPGDGAFAEYILATGDLQMKIPENMSYEEAASLGMGVATVGQGMYKGLGLPWPNEPAKEKFPVLIYGGSSAMGSYGIQYGILSGLDIIATASEKNFEHVKKLGASAVFDYKSPTCGADIRKHTNNSLLHAWDAISEADSGKIVAEALADPVPSGKELKYGTILPGKEVRADAKPNFTLMYTLFGEAFEKYGARWPASQEDFEFMKKFSTVSEKLIADGKIKPHTLELRDGGLDGILGGLQDMRDGKVSAKKLVYKIA